MPRASALALAAALLAWAGAARVVRAQHAGIIEENGDSAPSSEVATEPARGDAGVLGAPGDVDRAPEPAAVVADGAPRALVVMLGAGDVDPAMSDALTELLIAAVAARESGMRIVGKEELQARLGRGDRGTVECLESAACLGRMGVELGVSEVVAGTIARRTDADGEQVWVFVLTRFDVRGGELRGRVFREARGDLEALLRALEESFPELYARRIAPGRLVVRASVRGAEVALDGLPLGVFDGEPVRRETVEPGAHVLTVRAPGHRELVREIEIEEGATFVIDASLEPRGAWTASPLLYVGGGVALASLGVAIGLGVASQARPGVDLTMRETIDGFYPAREAEAVAANVLFGVAAAGAVAAAIGLFLSGEAEGGEREREREREQGAGGGPDARAWIAPALDARGVAGAALGIEGRF